MSTDAPTLPEALQMMGKCMAKLAELESERRRMTRPIWFGRAMALVCLSGAAAAGSGMVNYVQGGRELMAGAMAALAGLNAYCFAHTVYRTESMVHLFATLRREYEQTAARLAGIIGPLVAAQAQQTGGNEEYTTICTIVQKPDGVN